MKLYSNLDFLKYFILNPSIEKEFEDNHMFNFIKKCKNHFSKNYLIHKDKYLIDFNLPEDFKAKDYHSLSDHLPKNVSDDLIKIDFLFNLKNNPNLIYNIDTFIGKIEGNPYFNIYQKYYTNLNQQQLVVNFIKFLNSSFIKCDTKNVSIEEFMYRLFKNLELHVDFNTFLPEDFDLEMYKIINFDLKFKKNIDYVKNYLISKELKARYYKLDDALPSDFSTYEYKILNKELCNLCEIELKKHYIVHGKNEKRFYNILHKIPKNFIPSEYLKFNPDLVDYNEYKLRKHYAVQGIEENRIYSIDQLLPKNFLVNDYRDLNKDLQKFNDNDIKYHYYEFGNKESRLYNIKNNLPTDFKSENYIQYNSNYDLTKLNDRELQIHYVTKGKYEFRNYKALTGTEKLFNSYPFLFSKFLLKFVNFKSSINYIPIIAKLSNLKDKFWCHLHCYDLDLFKTYYKDVIDTISEFFNVIITYSVGDHKNFIFKNSCNVLLKIENRGQDIGGKIIAVTYLKVNNIDSKYILFLHSKTSKSKRDLYFKPLIKNLDKIFNLINTNDYGGFFPNLIIDNIYYILDSKYIIEDSIANKKNKILQEEFCEYMSLNKSINVFPEGNCYILHKDLYLKLFDSIFYNTLNKDDDFDPHWVKINHNLTTFCVKSIYHIAVNGNLFMNNSSMKKQINRSLRDSQIEHSFERLVFKLSSKIKKKIYLLPCDDDDVEETSHICDNINNYLLNH